MTSCHALSLSLSLHRLPFYFNFFLALTLGSGLHLTFFFSFRLQNACTKMDEYLLLLPRATNQYDQERKNCQGIAPYRPRKKKTKKKKNPTSEPTKHHHCSAVAPFCLFFFIFFCKTVNRSFRSTLLNYPYFFPIFRFVFIHCSRLIRRCCSGPSI